MANDPDKYPEKKKIKTQGRSVELSFKVLAMFGSHDLNESGEVLMEIADNTAKIHDTGLLSEEWKQIHDGIFLKSKTQYFTNMRESTVYVKLEPESCPVKLHVRHFYEYSASDYPHGNSYKENYYSIVVEL
jgi:hypothetical protein